jgi:hypothetical protein
MSVMTFGQCKVVHVGIEVVVALGTAVLGIGDNDVSRPTADWVAHVVKIAGDGAKPVRTAAA